MYYSVARTSGISQMHEALVLWLLCHVLAAHAAAQRRAGDLCLKALTVVLEAAGALAVAACGGAAT